MRCNDAVKGGLLAALSFFSPGLPPPFLSLFHRLYPLPFLCLFHHPAPAPTREATLFSTAHHAV